MEWKDIVETLYWFSDWTNTKVGRWLVRLVIVAGMEGSLWATFIKGGLKRSKAFITSFIVSLPVSFLIALSHRIVHYDDQGEKLETPIVFGWEKVASDTVVYWILASGTTMLMVDWFWPNRVEIWNKVSKVIPFANPIDRRKNKRGT